MVNVDIGGGTTDIAFATNANIQLVTSFKFASNSLFENPFSDNIRNGIIDWHKGDIYDLLEKKELGELKRIFNSPDNEIPSNMASFLFSLVDNSMVVEKGIDPKAIDFNRILQDDENFKIVFVLFYTSIIYHIAQIVKENYEKYVMFALKDKVFRLAELGNDAGIYGAARMVMIDD